MTAASPLVVVVGEYVDALTRDGVGRTHTYLSTARVGPKGEDAELSFLWDGWPDVIRVDVQVRAYWVAGRGRPSEPDSLPLAWASDPPRRVEP